MNRNTLRASFGVLAIAGLFTLSSCDPDETPTPTPVPGLTDFCDDIDGATTWTNNRDGADYRVSCIITVTSEMIIDEGTEIEFKDGAGIIVEPGGSLKVRGTSGNMVSMHGITNAVGSWKGLWILSNSNNNELNYCTVTGGGQSSFNGHDVKSNIRMGLDSKLGIMNSTISNSGRDGLYIDGFDFTTENPLRVFASNTFSNNGRYPITTIGTVIGTLDGMGSNYTGNTDNRIEIRGARLVGNHTWNKCSIPYYITTTVSAGYSSDQGNLLINPGTILQFSHDQGICTGEYSNGYLRMVGTASDRIKLESGDGSTWKGVCYQSTNGQNQLSYVDIDKGGTSSYTGAAQKKGNVILGAWSPGAASISNCSINNSASWGVFVSMGSTAPTITSTTYSGNASGNLEIE